jgi:hypothetical protein
VIELDVDEIGASLRYAISKIVKANRSDLAAVNSADQPEHGDEPPC